jgi:hypothetical protein
VKAAMPIQAENYAPVAKITLWRFQIWTQIRTA